MPALLLSGPLRMKIWGAGWVNARPCWRKITFLKKSPCKRKFYGYSIRGLPNYKGGGML
jgi:hypothetical protein